MDEQELEVLRRVKKEELEALRAKSSPHASIYIRALREEIIVLQAELDSFQQERDAEALRIAAENENAQSVIVQAEAAAAVTEAERILGG